MVEKSNYKERDKVFKGQFLHSIDNKGRLSIPSRLRKNVSQDADNSFVMTLGIDKCIEIYPKDQWKLIEEKLLKLNFFDQREARFIRMMLQNAHEDTMDAQSRILIPQPLLDYAGIKNEVLILGVLKKIELWDTKIYNGYLSGSPETFEQIASQVMRIE
ncbi:MAG: division/cell wall cluster transcriptional repressor MraZ [Ignavibacteriaceae bacterium]|nr:division/cell wall cluster transcriptional repressor MraZ [Ignavibacteriaceae bacterium]